MKRIVLFMVMVSMVCIASYAQKAAEGTKVLVAYFSATGNTEKAAQQVASIVSGDLHKIHHEKSYTSAGLNWRDKSSCSSVDIPRISHLVESSPKTHQHLFGKIQSLG